MSGSLKRSTNVWATVLLYTVITLGAVISFSHISKAQTALTYYSQNGYSKQLATFPDDIKFIDTYSRYTTVVTNDDTIYSGYYAQATPENVITGISNIKSAKMLNNGSGMILTEDGTVWIKAPDQAPQQVPNIPPIQSIDLGFADNYYALDYDGNVWGWGNNSRASLGSLGNCTNGQPWCNTGNYVSEPSIIPGLTNITEINAGDAGLIATNTNNDRLLVGTVCRVESNWPIYVAPHIYSQVTNIQSINLDSCSLNSLTTTGDVYSWGVAGMEGFLMPNAKQMNVSLGSVKKIYSDNDRDRLALTPNNDLYFYDYFGNVFDPPTEMFIRHIDDDSIQLFPYSYTEEGQSQTWGYITTSDPEPIINRARTIGQGKVQPSIENGDSLPGLISAQQTDKIRFNVDVRRNNNGVIRPTSNFDFTYETGQRCNNPNRAVNCHTTQLQSTIINTIDVDGTNRSRSVIKGSANLTIDGVVSQKYFTVTYVDNSKLNNGLADTMHITIFNDQAQTDPVYYVLTTDLTTGNIRIR